MNRCPVPFAGLAIVVAAGLGGGGVSAQTAPVPPAAAAASASRPIPAAVIGKLLEQVAAKGRDSALPGPIASALGLPAGEAWTNRQFAVRSSATGAVHTIAAGARADSDLVLSNRGDAAITIFRIRRDGALVSAVYFFPLTQTNAVLPPAEAAHDFDEERLFWIRAIDMIGADN